MGPPSPTTQQFLWGNPRPGPGRRRPPPRHRHGHPALSDPGGPSCRSAEPQQRLDGARRPAVAAPQRQGDCRAAASVARQLAGVGRRPCAPRVTPCLLYTSPSPRD
eukprot:6145893-Alexandrium_andersonii.AAC.1